MDPTVGDRRPGLQEGESPEAPPPYRPPGLHPWTSTLGQPAAQGQYAPQTPFYLALTVYTRGWTLHMVLGFECEEKGSTSGKSDWRNGAM
eukprot:338333-Prorocentrum_minimum.AAC.2